MERVSTCMLQHIHPVGPRLPMQQLHAADQSPSGGDSHRPHHLAQPCLPPRPQYVSLCGNSTPHGQCMHSAKNSHNTHTQSALSLHAQAECKDLAGSMRVHASPPSPMSRRNDGKQIGTALACSRARPQGRAGSCSSKAEDMRHSMQSTHRNSPPAITAPHSHPCILICFPEVWLKCAGAAAVRFIPTPR